MRLPLTAGAVIAVLLASLLGQPAHAAPAKPAAVGLVSVVAAQPYLDGAQKRARVKVSWPKAARATGYQIFVSGTRAKVVKKKKATKAVRTTSAWLPNLRRNKTYWIQVRALNGSRAGARSAPIARITPIAPATLSTATHPVHSMMSYNICSNACTSRPWAKRMPLVVDRILAVRPGVVAVQEASQWKNAVVPGYTEALGGHDNRIFYRDSTYEQVTQQLTPEQTSQDCPLDETGVRIEPCVLPVDGVADPPGKDAPWVMLRHRRSGQQVVFVAMHLKVDGKTSMAAYRADQTAAVFEQLTAQLAWWGHDLQQTPVALIGDFNSNRSRAGDLHLESTMRANGFWDAYEQARKLTGQHQNTANPNWQWRTPVIGVTWGDHVDKVWVRPNRSLVRRWANVGLMSGSQYVTPLPSDHHPLLVNAQLS